MSNVDQVRRQVEQLRREAAVQRTPVSRAGADLKKYIEDHQNDDILVNGFANQKENPFKEKSGCTML